LIRSLSMIVQSVCRLYPDSTARDIFTSNTGRAVPYALHSNQHYKLYAEKVKQ
jgi:hypothetical protein